MLRAEPGARVVAMSAAANPHCVAGLAPILERADDAGHPCSGRPSLLTLEPLLLALLHRLGGVLPAQAAASEELGEVANDGTVHVPANERRRLGLLVEHVAAVLQPSVVVLDVTEQILFASKGALYRWTEEAAHGRQRAWLSAKTAQRRTRMKGCRCEHLCLVRIAAMMTAVAAAAEG